MKKVKNDIWVQSDIELGTVDRRAQLFTPVHLTSQLSCAASFAPRARLIDTGGLGTPLAGSIPSAVVSVTLFFTAVSREFLVLQATLPSRGVYRTLLVTVIPD